MKDTYDYRQATMTAEAYAAALLIDSLPDELLVPETGEEDISDYKGV